MNRLEDLKESMLEKQNDIINEIKINEEQIASLANLDKLMKNCKCFDQEDYDALSQEIDNHNEQRISLGDKLSNEKNKQKIQKEVFEHLSEVIRNRQELLDEADGSTDVLACHPVLLQYLAKKQIKLQKILEKQLKEN